MDGWTDDAIEARIRGLYGEDWRALASHLHQDLGRWVLEEQITFEQAERVTAAIQDRQYRTRRAAKMHDARNHYLGSIVQAQALANVRPPVADSPLPPVREHRAGVRGPSQHTPEQRSARAYERKRQAKMAKVPAALWADYDCAGSAAISIIVMDCAAHGQCERSVARIAASAAVSRRSVQYALRNAARRGLLSVAQRKGSSHLVTMRDPKLIDWVEKLKKSSQAFFSENEISLPSKDKKRSPPRGAIECAPSPVFEASGHDPDLAKNVVVPGAIGVEPEPVAPSDAHAAPPSAVKLRGPLDDLFDRLNSEVASEAKIRDEREAMPESPQVPDREHGPVDGLTASPAVETWIKPLDPLLERLRALVTSEAERRAEDDTTTNTEDDDEHGR